MREAMTLVLSQVSGVLLGAFFFGGLWWTVRKAVSSERPARWLLGSLLVRMSIALTGFYFVADGHWERLLLCVLGFFVTGQVARRLAPEGQPRPGEETGHAPHAR